MLALLLAAHGAAIPAAWDLRENARHRWVITSEIVLPTHIVLLADRNRDARARTVLLELVVGCVAREPSVRVGHLACTVEDAAVAGATYPNQHGRLLPVLEEMDRKLTGASLDIVMRDDGHLRTVRLDPVQLRPEQNQRTRAMDETLRTLLVRALAPFDLGIPETGFEEGGWPQYHSAWFGLPSLHGTAGGGELVHTAERWDAERVVVSSAGRAILVDGAHLGNGTPVYLRTDLRGTTVFDVAAGRVSESLVEVSGETTASAGPFTRVYRSRTAMRALGEDEPMALGPTVEWDPWRFSR